MIKITSNIPQKADEFLSGLERQIDAAVHRALVKTATVGEARVRGIMEKEAYDTGRLLRSVTSIITATPEQLRLLIGTNLDYGFQVEKGRKPGKWPNLDALVKWCGRKLRRAGVNTRVNVTFDELKTLARTGGKPATDQQKAFRAHLAMVYLVGRKIATKGIRQKRIFARLEDALLAYFRDQTRKELQSL